MKKLMTCLALGTFATLVGAAWAPVAYAQSDKENSTFTIAEPVEVGPFTLQPGTYLIKVVMRASDRYTCQVTNVDRSQVFATVLTTPHEIRPDEVLSSTRYVYYTATPGQPKALRSWFPRDSDHGHDIVYPRRRAMELAAAVKEPVIALPDEVKEAEYTTAPLTIVTPERTLKPYEAPVVVQKAPEPPPPVVAEARPRERMPKTASHVPLYAALGLLSLGGALALRTFASRMA